MNRLLSILCIAFVIVYLWLHYTLPMPPERPRCDLECAELCQSSDVPEACARKRCECAVE